MKKATIINFELVLTIRWECPYCHTINATKIHPSPYNAISEDPFDEDCPNCHEFVTIQI